MGDQLRVLIVEDQWMFEDALRIVLEDESDIIVLPAATDAVGAIEAVCLHHPDVVLLDADTDAAGGYDLARTILRERPRTRVVMMSALPDADMERRSLEAGTHGLISKRQAAVDLASLLRTAVDER